MGTYAIDYLEPALKTAHPGFLARLALSLVTALAQIAMCNQVFVQNVNLVTMAITVLSHAVLTVSCRLRHPLVTFVTRTMAFVMADVIMVGMGKHVAINVLLIVWVINVLWILVNVIWVVSMTNMENTVKILVLTVQELHLETVTSILVVVYMVVKMDILGIHAHRLVIPDVKIKHVSIR